MEGYGETFMNNARKLKPHIFTEEYTYTLLTSWISISSPNESTAFQVIGYQYRNNTIRGHVLDHRGKKSGYKKL